MSNTTVNQKQGLDQSHAQYDRSGLNGAAVGGPFLTGAEAAGCNPIIQAMLAKQRHELRLEQLRLLSFLKKLTDEGNSNASLDPNLPPEGIQSPKKAPKPSGQAQADSAQLEPQTDTSVFSTLEQEAKSSNPTVSEGAAIEEGLLVGAQKVTNPNSDQGRNAIFEAAGKMQKLVKEFENNMIKSLDREIVIAQAQLKALEQMLNHLKEGLDHQMTEFKSEKHQNLKAFIDFLKQQKESLGHKPRN